MRADMYHHGSLEHRICQGLLLAYYSTRTDISIEPYKTWENFGILPDILLSEPVEGTTDHGRRFIKRRHYFAIEIETDERNVTKTTNKYEMGIMTKFNVDVFVVTSKMVRNWFSTMDSLKSINEVLP